MQQSIEIKLKGSFEYHSQTSNHEISNFTDNFVFMIQSINSNPKYPQYLGRLNLTLDKLKNSLQFIMFRCKALKSDLICNFLNNYIQEKQLRNIKGKQLLVQILQIQTKLGCVLNFLPQMQLQQFKVNKQVWQHVTFDNLGTTEQVKNGYAFLKKMLCITTCAIIHQQKHSSCCCKNFVFGLSYPQYFFRKKESRLQCLIFYRNPSLHIAQNMWNLPEKGAIKHFAKLKFDSIKYNMKIYVGDQHQDIFTQGKDTVMVRILHNKKILRADGNKLETNNEKTDVILHMHGGGFIALSSRSMQNYTRKWANALEIPIFSVDYRMPPQHKFPTAPYDCFRVYKFLLTRVQKYLQLRINRIFVAGDSAGGNLACAVTALALKEKLTIPKGLYLMYPALDLRVAFSPSKLHAITDPLLWPSVLLLCLQEYLTSKNQSNHPLASPLLLTKHFLQQDYSQISFQKAEQIKRNTSKKQSFVQQDIKTQQICFTQNQLPTNQEKKEQNLQETFIKGWPKTYISVGKKDPLYDDSIRLMEKLIQINVQCKCKVYEKFSHGFMSTEPFIGVCKEAIQNSIGQLKELMKQ